jgi:formate C-acetyltransferase
VSTETATLITTRLVRLREAMRARPPLGDSYEGNWPYWLAALTGPGGRLPARRFADGFCRVLAIAEPVLYPEELIAGAFSLRAPTPDEQRALEAVAIARGALPSTTIDGHYGIDHDLLLRAGLAGVRAQVETRLAALDPTHGEDAAAHVYLLAARDCLDAALDFADRLATVVAAAAAAEADLARRAELEEMAAVCRRVPRQPAETFHEALQSVWLVQMLCRIENGQCAGRFDRTFLDFYRRDLAAGRFTEARARELIGAFLIKYNEFGSWPQGALLGGLDAQGRDTTNELTYLFLEAQGELGLLNPATCVGWNAQTPPELLAKAVDYLCRGNSLPALMNDEIIVPSLVAAGVPLAEAVNYLNSTCVEISVQGASGIRVVEQYLPFPQVLGRALHNGQDGFEYKEDSFPSGAPEALTTFAELLDAVKAQFAWALETKAAQTNRSILGFPSARAYPFSSCFVHDCLERGRDWCDGGPRYNFCYPQLVGLPNVVDSLLAIQEIVYEQHELTLAEFTAIVDANFAGHEPLRQRILNSLPKWGTHDEAVDALARELVEFYYAQVRGFHSALPNGQFYPGFLCWITHSVFGRIAPATPDGRLAGTAFADSLAANQGRARGGPTGEIASLNQLDFHGALGGMVYNLRLNRTMYNSAEGRRKLGQLLETYFRGGGFQAQISVVDREMLEEARRHPEKYADLMVKVGGYSDYFVALSPELQEALIAKDE